MGEPEGRPLGLRLRHAWDEPWAIFVNSLKVFVLTVVDAASAAVIASPAGAPIGQTGCAVRTVGGSPVPAGAAETPR